MRLNNSETLFLLKKYSTALKGEKELMVNAMTVPLASQGYGD